MTAAVLPFPAGRRHGSVAKQIARASLVNPDFGVRYLQYQLKLQGDAMRRRGIEEVVQRELRCIASAVRRPLPRNLALTYSWR